MHRWTAYVAGHAEGRKHVHDIGSINREIVIGVRWHRARAEARKTERRQDLEHIFKADGFVVVDVRLATNAPVIAGLRDERIRCDAVAVIDCGCGVVVCRCWGHAAADSSEDLHFSETDLKALRTYLSSVVILVVNDLDHACGHRVECELDCAHPTTVEAA